MTQSTHHNEKMNEYQAMADHIFPDRVVKSYGRLPLYISLMNYVEKEEVDFCNEKIAQYEKEVSYDDLIENNFKEFSLPFEVKGIRSNENINQEIQNSLEECLRCIAYLEILNDKDNDGRWLGFFGFDDRKFLSYVSVLKVLERNAFLLFQNIVNLNKLKIGSAYFATSKGGSEKKKSVNKKDKEAVVIALVKGMHAARLVDFGKFSRLYDIADLYKHKILELNYKVPFLEFKSDQELFNLIYSFLGKNEFYCKSGRRYLLIEKLRSSGFNTSRRKMLLDEVSQSLARDLGRMEGVHSSLCFMLESFYGELTEEDEDKIYNASFEEAETYMSKLLTAESVSDVLE